jgi:hypothetical protein
VAAAVLGRWRSSGLSADAFAGREGISASRLWYWSKRLSEPSSVSFVRVPVPDGSRPEPRPHEHGIELEVGGVTVRVREDLGDERIARLCAALSIVSRPC